GYAIPNNGIGYSYSTDNGLTWTDEPGPPVLPPFGEVVNPTASCLGPGGEVHLVTDHEGVQYFHGTGLNPIAWADPLIALDYSTYAPNATVPLNSFETHSIACDPGLGYVYLCTTEELGDSRFSSSIVFARSLDNGATWQQQPLHLSGP